MLAFMIPGFAARRRRQSRTTLLLAAIVFLIFAVPYFSLINTGSFLLATIAESIGFGFVFGFGCGASPTFYTQTFPIRYRAWQVALIRSRGFTAAA